MEVVAEHTNPSEDADQLVDAAVALVAQWLERAATTTTGVERKVGNRLHELIQDPAGVAFAMRFVDRVVRPEGDDLAAEQLATLVERRGLPGFLSTADKLLLGAGARLAPRLPDLVMPLAQRRMRQLVGHLVLDADDEAMEQHLRRQREAGHRLNVNMLGEAVLGEDEADRRLQATIDLVRRPDVDYVSVKVSAIAAQLNPWDHDGNVDRIVTRLRPLLSKASITARPTFVNLDMEEYHDLELTIEAFTRILDEDEFHDFAAGIVLQAYLPDAFDALQRLVAWANERHRRLVDGRPGAPIKIRLVKGANLAMEQVEATLRGWEQTPYTTKADTDANYKRCLDWLLDDDRLTGVRVGVASHNLFDVAWAHLLARHRLVSDRVEFEMLQGMAPAQARMVREATGSILLYTPVVHPDDFDVAISYLFRRLEENAAPDNFIRHLFTIGSDAAAFRAEQAKFTEAVARRWEVETGPRRTQDRSLPLSHRPVPPASGGDNGFVNEPDTDPVLAANRDWIDGILVLPPDPPKTGQASTTGEVDAVVTAAERALADWSSTDPATRGRIITAVAEELSRRRGELIAALVNEGGKTVAQADPEVSEAIDFARWYGREARNAGRSPSADYRPRGVVAVVPPWNFPAAIPAGGVLAALAAGNAVVLKPAPATPRCAEIVAECCWAAGVGDALQFIRVPDGRLGRHLIDRPAVSAVVFTGSKDTADRFRSWRPSLPIFGETSGKNAMIISPHADVDLAVADLVDSAFGHAGQKCSAASLAICVGDVYHSGRFRRQLRDAVRSLATGPASAAATTMGPLIGSPNKRLDRALRQLEPGEDWLVKPRRLGGAHQWSPGVRLGVQPGSWFHTTECFGPVLGVMAADDLDHAIELQNSTGYGLTGGLHTLDPNEIDRWIERVEVGNAYVNRTTTGAIVGRQPFGGWKGSVVGPGAKAGGPNYVTQLGRWEPNDRSLDDAVWLTNAAVSDARWWADEFGVDHDPQGLWCESNVFRYRPLPRIAVRLQPDGLPRELERVQAAAEVCGVPVVLSDCDVEAPEAFADRLGSLDVVRVRVIGTVDPVLRQAANELGVHLAHDPVTTDGRLELPHYLREQVISRTLHRYGNRLV
ncbi:MAG: bifunctional proline dehydrogenase/L-glutamate gamma-semialdehyde dehydrogenase [Actinomycetota bacterium]